MIFIGMGFKSEEDKQAYLASLGDPLEHPLFAETAEDCKGKCINECIQAYMFVFELKLASRQTVYSCVFLCFSNLDHPLAGAFRALNEEGKTSKELAEMYKEEGNEWLKGTKSMINPEQMKHGECQSMYILFEILLLVYTYFKEPKD